MAGMAGMAAGLSNVFKQTPIPTAGLALGLAALGNLLQTSIPQPLGGIVRAACGIVSALLVALLVVRVVRYSGAVLEDFRNPIFASVSGTFFMALMQLATYLRAVRPCAGVRAVGRLRRGACGAHRAGSPCGVHRAASGWTTCTRPTFICYVGIVVGSVTAAVRRHAEPVGRGRPVLRASPAYAGAARARDPGAMPGARVPEPARPLFCIYAAPMSLVARGVPQHACPVPNAGVRARARRCWRSCCSPIGARAPAEPAAPASFYPSYAAMTFPFVITATALSQDDRSPLPRAGGVAVPPALGCAPRRRDRLLAACHGAATCSCAT